MMKVPVISVDAPVSVVAPSGGNEALRAAYGMTGEIQNLIGTISEENRRFREKQKEIEQSTEISEVVMDMEEANQAIINNLKLNPDPQNHFSNWQTSFRKATKERLDKISDPDTRAKATVVVNRMEAQELVPQAHEGRVLWIDTMLARRERVLAKKAKTGDLEGGLKDIEDDVLNGLRDPLAAEKRKTEYQKEIETERQKTIFTQADKEIDQNPYKTDEILRKEEYEGLPEDKKDLLRSRGATKTEKQDKIIEKTTKDFSDQIYGDLILRTRAGEDVSDLIAEYGPSGQRLLVQGDFDKLLNEQDAKGKATKGVFDKDIELEVQIRSNQAVPQITEKEINDLMRSKKLDPGVGEKALDQIRTTNRLLRDEGQQKVNQGFADAEKHINRGMGLSGLVIQTQEKIDPTQQGLITRAQTELWERSQGRGGKEDPMAVAKEILPKYQKALRGQNLLSIKTYERLIEIDKYPTPDALHNAWISKKMSDADYYRKSKAFKEIAQKLDLDRIVGELEKEGEGFGRK